MVGMTMGDLLLAVLAPVDVGDAQRVRLSRNACHGDRGVFIANGVGHIATHACGDEVEAERGAAGEPRPKHIGGLDAEIAQLQPQIDPKATEALVAGNVLAKALKLLNGTWDKVGQSGTKATWALLAQDQPRQRKADHRYSTIRFVAATRRVAG
jgi:hypothetical protein